MSQRAVEAVLGRLITDVEFRMRFFAEPGSVCRENDILLTPRETTALLQVSVQSLHGVTVKLDPKIVRAAIAHTQTLERAAINDLRAEPSERQPVTGLRRE
jgi:hypothetical protein